MLGNENALWLLFLVPLIIIPAYLWYFYAKSNALKTFADTHLIKKLNTNSSTARQITKFLLILTAVIFIIIALTQPMWNPKPVEIKRTGRDVAILLDVSRSMLAEDIKPSRLERAKLAIKDLLNVLQGDRIAIMTFAGSATIKAPLTNNYGFINMVLDRDISTESTPLGGTNLGDAIRKATREIFSNSQKNYSDLIIISDGEENQQTFPAQAAADASEKGIRIIAIGLGSTEPGARIPIYENGKKTYLTHDGREVWTKLNPQTLADVATATENGKFLTVGPNQTFDLDQLYKDLVAAAEKRQMESAQSIRYEQKFQIFLAISIIILFIEVMTGERKKS